MRITAAGRTLTVAELRDALLDLSPIQEVCVDDGSAVLAVETFGWTLSLESSAPSVDLFEGLAKFVISIIDGTGNTKRDIVADAQQLQDLYDLRSYL
jgi:hypothetical protein